MPRSELQKKLDRIKRSAETPLQRKERRAKRKQEKARREAEAEVPVPTRSADKSTSPEGPSVAKGSKAEAIKSASDEHARSRPPTSGVRSIIVKPNPDHDVARRNKRRRIGFAQDVSTPTTDSAVDQLTEGMSHSVESEEEYVTKETPKAQRHLTKPAAAASQAKREPMRPRPDLSVGQWVHATEPCDLCRERDTVCMMRVSSKARTCLLCAQIRRTCVVETRYEQQMADAAETITTSLAQANAMLMQYIVNRNFMRGPEDTTDAGNDAALQMLQGIARHLGLQ